MADLEISIGINAKAAKTGADEAKSAIRGVGDETERTGKKTKSASDRDLSGLQASLARVGEFAKAAGAKIAAIGAVISAAGAAAAVASKIIFDLAKAFSDYAIQIKRANDVTGLSISLLAGLRTQATLTGRSFDDIGAGINNFVRVIGEANNGSKEAAAKLARLGIDGKAALTNLDGALQAVINRILSVPAGIEQMNAAADAFGGDLGAKLIPFLKDFGGNLNEAKQKAEELGLALTEDGVRSAAEFNRSYAEVQLRLEGIKLELGQQLLPVVRDTFRDFNGWLRENRAEISSWATFIVDAVKTVARAIEREVDDIRGIIDVFRVFIEPAGTVSPTENYRRRQQQRYYRDVPLPPVDPAVQNAVPTRIPGLSYETPYFSGPTASKPISSRGRSGIATPAKNPIVEDADRIRKVIQDLNLQIQYFGNSSEEASVKQRLMQQGVLLVNKGLADQAIALGATLDKMKAADEAAKAQEKLKKDFAMERADITNRSFRTNVGLGIEKAVLDEQIRLGRELSQLEEFRTRTAGERILAERELQERGFTGKQIAEMVDIWDIERGRTEEILKQVQAREDQRRAEAEYRSALEGLNQELMGLNVEMGIAAEVTREYQVQKMLLTEAYKNLTGVQKEQLLATAREIDAAREAVKAQKEAQQAYDQVFQTVQRHLDVLAEQGFGAFFKSVFGQFKQFLRDMVAEWLTSQFFRLFFKGGNNQTAQQNGQGGGIFGGILNGIFGRGATGVGPGGTPTFSGGGAGGGNPLDGINIGSGGFNPRTGTYSGGGGGGGMLGGLFGPRENILTGQTSRLGGIMGGIGAIASVAGSAIGGRFGGILSAAGTGASIGAMFGPWGAAIGAGIGALFGIFSGDPKRKRDKREKLPELNRGFTDAMQQLRDLIRDVRTLRVDPDSAISRAQELRTQIASGFGIQFESKKYRKQAQTLIRQRTAEADTLIEELRRVAEVSRAAGERQRRIIPEFASGVYISRDFLRQLSEQRRQMNGMIPGRFRGQDNVPAMLSPGEMVLNPAQQERTRRAAGFDVFRSAGIPGYSGGEQRGQGGQMPAITLVLEHNIDSEGMVRTTLKNSPAVQQQLQLTIEDLSANGRLNQRRRGV